VRVLHHQLNSYITSLTGESNPPSAEKRTGAVAVPVLLHNQPSAELTLYIPPLTGESTPQSAEERAKSWLYYYIMGHQLSSHTPALSGERNPPSAEKRTGALTVLLHHQPSADLIHSPTI
jgi:hypothetical protein